MTAMAVSKKMLLIFVLAIAAVLFALPTLCEANAPAWTKERTIQRNGNSLVLICDGYSPLAKDLAFKAAVASCKSIAVEQINGDAKVKTLVISTEQDSALNEEISSEKQVTGLAPKILESVTDKDGEGGYRTFIKAKYDLAKAKVVSLPEGESAKSESANPLVNGEGVNAQSNNKIERKALTRSGNRTLILTTVPTCSSIIIRGDTRPRVIRCKEGVMTVTINADDRELIARPPKGFLPKHISFPSSNRKPSSDDYDTDEIEIYFERN